MSISVEEFKMTVDTGTMIAYKASDCGMSLTMTKHVNGDLTVQGCRNTKSIDVILNLVEAIQQHIMKKE